MQNTPVLDIQHLPVHESVAPTQAKIGEDVSDMSVYDADSEFEKSWMSLKPLKQIWEHSF